MPGNYNTPGTKYKTMKKYLLTAVTLLLTLSAFAQETEPEEILGPTTIQQDHNRLSGSDAPNSGFGLKGGLNYTMVNGNDADGLDPFASFHGGAYAQFALSESFSLQIEGLYSRKGFKADKEYRFDYLELPFLVVYNLNDNFSLHLGPQLSVMMISKEDGNEINLDDLNTFDYGFAGGAEYRIGFARLGARYNLGLAELMDEGDTGLPFGRNIKTGVAQLYIGVGF